MVGRDIDANKGTGRVPTTGRVPILRKVRPVPVAEGQNRVAAQVQSTRRRRGWDESMQECSFDHASWYVDPTGTAVKNNHTDAARAHMIVPRQPAAPAGP